MTKSIYLTGREVILNGDQECEDFIATHITNKATVENIYWGLELVFENNQLKEVYEYTEGKRKEYNLKRGEIAFPYVPFEENKILQLKEDENGPHQLGGEIPDDFSLPENNCIVPFQYLGFISNQDNHFHWLPFTVHLTCPIYLNIDKVFLDYSDPGQPFIINKEEVEDADTSYEEDLNQDTEIVFNEMRFSFVETESFPGEGHAGIPNWIQKADIPICPKSGKRMKFLIQLNGGVSAKRTNVEPQDEDYRHYYEELNFWGAGNLFVFFEPTSKVACYLIQNS